jgi:hypothetical protein
LGQSNGKASFRIDAKQFTLAFDGGRVDPYQIIETRGKFRGSLWLSGEGLHWILELIGIIRKPETITDGFFRFLKNGYRTLEFSCLKNRGGRFVELCDYHSGAQQGGIRIPEGRSGAGWDRFTTEIRHFFLGENSAANGTGREKRGAAVVACAADVACAEQKLRNPRKGRKSNPRDLRRQRDTRDLLQQPKIFKLHPRAEMSIKEPRPTRKFVFKWNPHPNTLVISKREGESRKAKWIGLSEITALLETIKQTRPALANGPNLNEESRPTYPISNTHSKKWVGPSNDPNPFPDPGFLIKSGGSGNLNPHPRPTDEVPESSRQAEPPMVNSIMGESSMGLSNPLDVADLGHLPPKSPVTSKLGETEMGLQIVASGEIEEAEMPMEDRDEEMEASGRRSSPTALYFADEVGEPWSPLSNTPLCVVEPSVTCLGDGVDALTQPSKWVDKQMNKLRKQVGVSIQSHEAECLALLRKIEAERNTTGPTSGPKKKSAKGSRELRNLVSSVNYDGKQLVCC